MSSTFTITLKVKRSLRGVVFHLLKRACTVRRSQSAAAEGPEEDKWRRNDSAVRFVRLPGCLFPVTMNAFGSQHALNAGQRVGSRSDLTGGGNYQYARSDVAIGGAGNGHAFGEGFRSKTIMTKSVKGGARMSSTLGSATISGASYAMNVSNKAKQQQGLCQEYLLKAEQSLQAGSGDSEYFMGMARDALERLNSCAMEMGQLGLSNENVLRSADLLNAQWKELYGALSNTMVRRKSTRKSSGGAEDRGRILMNDALAWIAAQKAGTNSNTHRAARRRQNQNIKPNPNHVSWI
ncbi:uncharacterized protein V3H82_010038 [Fundulus diaphanus]